MNLDIRRYIYNTVMYYFMLQLFYIKRRYVILLHYNTLYSLYINMKIKFLNISICKKICVFTQNYILIYGFTIRRPTD